MDTNIKKKIEGDSYKKRPDVKVGDHVKLYMRIIEGKKERVQQFKGVVIAIKGTGLNKNLVVRKISYGIGVERIVPLHSPMLDKIEIVKRGSVRKSKLFYLRKRVGRRALKIDNVKDVYMTDDVEVPEEGEPEVQEEVEQDSEVIEEEVVDEEKKDEKKEESEEEK